MKRIFKILIFAFLSIFILLNIIAYNNAYRFSNYSKTQTPELDYKNLSFFQKSKILFFGIEKPKSKITNYPLKAFSSHTLYAGKDTLSAWLIKSDSSKGTVILFHGYGSNKSDVLPEANGFLELGFNVFLVDMRGHGESTGFQTSIGFWEAENVVAAYNFIIKNSGDSPVYLHGISMGAVAVLRAVGIRNIHPDAVIVECPYGSMLHAAKNRFDILGVPAFPSAHLLVFWGGFQNGFNGFENNTIEVSKNINVPVLILYGEKDDRATPAEIKSIYKNISSTKEIVAFPFAGHESYIKADPIRWKRAVKTFIKAASK